MALTDQQRKLLEENAGKYQQKASSTYIPPSQWVNQKKLQTQIGESQGFLSEMKDRLIGTVKGIGGTVEQVGETIAGAGKRGAETLGRLASGELNPATGGLAFVGDVARGISESIGDTIFGAGKAVLPVEVENKVKDSFTKLVEPIIGPVEDVQTAWEKVKKEHPNLAEATEGLLNIGMLGMDIFGGGQAGKAGKRAVKEGLEVAGDVTARTSKKALEGVTDLAEKVSPKVKELGQETAEFGLSKVSGLEQDTIKQILKDPLKVTEAQKAGLSDASLAHKVKETLEERLEALSETGERYKTIRQMDGKVELPGSPSKIDAFGRKKETLSAPKQFLKKEFGISFDEKGVIVRSSKGKALSRGDKSALMEFLEVYGDKSSLDYDEFLNARQSLDKLAAFGKEKTKASEEIATALRKFYDNSGKQQIPGLEKLDNEVAPEIKILKKLRKEYLTPDGELKDNALSKIANISNKRKDKALERLRELIPDIEEQANILKAIEDVEAGGKRVGAYTSVIGGFGLVTGNIPAVILAIAAQPKTLLKLILKFKDVVPDATGLIQKLKQGIPLKDADLKAVQEILEKAGAGTTGAGFVGGSEAIKNEYTR